MEDVEYTAPKLYAYLEVDPGPDATHPRPDSVELGAGYLVIGVEVEGVRVPLRRSPAGGFLDDIERAKTKK